MPFCHVIHRRWRNRTQMSPLRQVTGGTAPLCLPVPIGVWVPRPTLQSGKSCPECGRGKVYRQQEPAALIRFVGRPPLEATVFAMERLRCNACGQVFTAAEPERAGSEKYDVTAVAMIALLKYGTGVPFHRLERLEGQLGMPLPATTRGT